MKTILFTFALPLALCAAVGATAQTKSSMMPAMKADTVMMSETTDGDYLVRKYVVQNDADTGYSLFYKIGTWNLEPKFDGNAVQLEGLDGFIGLIDRDSMMKVQSIVITGYASPDGPKALNMKLAKGRAESLKSYVEKKYPLSKKYNMTTQSVVFDWMAAREAIAASDVPDKQTVLNIIDQHDPAPATEKRLKAMPQVWSYLAEKILPPMRYSEIAIRYIDIRLLEKRTMLPKPKPEPQPEPECYNPCDCVDIQESVSGILVEMPDVGNDF